MNPIRRLASMERTELQFRSKSAVRRAASHVKWRVRRPRWERKALDAILISPGEVTSAPLAQARASARADRWWSAHRALATHFATRTSAFPIQASSANGVAERIRLQFPGAVAESAARANQILGGRYDVLGYHQLAFGHPPRWHYDPVHDRTSPPGFWSAIPYLKPGSGDHKVIWEINRHQHWLALGRAYLLTQERRYYNEFVDQLKGWLAANPPLSGTNWASMLELGFRSLSWMWSLHMFAGAAAGLDDRSTTAREGLQGHAAPEREPWTVDLLVGLDRQLTHIEHNLSRYFSPNTHLTGEALALYVSGLTLPELAASPRRAALGRSVLLDEIARQVRPDGGHAELSAHYHRYSTDFYLLALLVARAGRDDAAAAFEEAARRQAHWLRSIADDRGRLPLLGDDDGGQLFPVCGRAPSDAADTLANAAVLLGEPGLAVGPLPEETFWLCADTFPLEHQPSSPAPWPSTALESTGYYVSRNTRGDHLVFDAGPHGYLNGGHAHSDALSVVLTLAGQPLLVDPGTATYTMDPEIRDRFRSTAMHNTVVLHGRPQSAPSGPFKWGSTAQARASVWSSSGEADYVEGQHDGYAPHLHVRGVLSVHGFGWLIVDHLLGAGDAVAETFWHLHPDWSAVSSREGVVTLQHRDGRLHAIAASADLGLLSCDGSGLGAYAPAYGRIEPTACVGCRTTGVLPRSLLTFIPATSVSPGEVSIREVAVKDAPPQDWHAAAYRLTCDGVSATFLTAIERSGATGSAAAAPATIWGTGDARTDGRLALVITRGRHPAEAVVVNGHRIETPGGGLTLDTSGGIVRLALAQPTTHP